MSKFGDFAQFCHLNYNDITCGLLIELEKFNGNLVIFFVCSAVLYANVGRETTTLKIKLSFLIIEIYIK